MVPLIALIVFLGVYPKPVLERIEPSVKRLLVHVEEVNRAAGRDFHIATTEDGEHLEPVADRGRPTSDAGRTQSDRRPTAAVGHHRPTAEAGPVTRLLTAVLAADTAPPRIATPQIAWRGAAAHRRAARRRHRPAHHRLAHPQARRPPAGTRRSPSVVALAAGAHHPAAVGPGAGLGHAPVDRHAGLGPAGPFSTVAGAVGIDGFSLFVAVVICATVVLGALLADDYLRREGLNGPEFYALLLIAGVRRRGHGHGQRLHRAVPRPRDAVDRRLRAVGHAPAPGPVAGGGPQVLRARRASRRRSCSTASPCIYGGTGSTSFIGIRNYFGAGVDRHRHRRPRPRADPRRAHPARPRAAARRARASRSRPCRSTPGAPTSTTARPTPSVAFMAGAVKAAAFAALVRVFVRDLPQLRHRLAADRHRAGRAVDVRRLGARHRADQRQAHAGLLVDQPRRLHPDGRRGRRAPAAPRPLLFYLAAYTFMVAGSFGVVSLVVGPGRRAARRSTTTGACRRRTRCWPARSWCSCWPRPACPFTSGFFAKFYVIAAVDDAQLYWLAIVAMVPPVIAAFLYLRVIVAMYMTGGDHGDDAEPATPACRVGVRGPHRPRRLRARHPRHRASSPRPWSSLAQHGTPILVEPPAPTPPPAGTGEPTPPPDPPPTTHRPLPVEPAAAPARARRARPPDFVGDTRRSLGSANDVLLRFRAPVPHGRPHRRPVIGA